VRNFPLMNMPYVTTPTGIMFEIRL
jgi:hypothetical protein